MSWSADAGFIWKDEFGFTFGHDGSIGWLLGPNERPLVLEGDALSAIREAGDITRLFDPAGAYAQLGAVTETVFDNRSCHAIAATTPEGYERTLYFDRATGLYAGHDGEGIHLWTVTDYREFNGIRLPVRWAFFEPIRGEMDLAVFDDVELDVAFEPEVFAVPWIVRQFTRAPEVVARDEARLQREHAAILGRWLPSPADSASFTIALEVREGFLVLRQDEDEELDYLHEPDDDGRMAMVGREYVQIEPVHDDDDNVEAIRIVIGGEPRYRFERSSEP